MEPVSRPTPEVCDRDDEHAPLRHLEFGQRLRMELQRERHSARRLTTRPTPDPGEHLVGRDPRHGARAEFCQPTLRLRGPCRVSFSSQRTALLSIQALEEQCSEAGTIGRRQP